MCTIVYISMRKVHVDLVFWGVWHNDDDTFTIAQDYFCSPHLAELAGDVGFHVSIFWICETPPHRYLLRDNSDALKRRDCGQVTMTLTRMATTPLLPVVGLLAHGQGTRGTLD
jgi:hypothetical protein